MIKYVFFSFLSQVNKIVKVSQVKKSNLYIYALNLTLKRLNLLNFRFVLYWEAIIEYIKISIQFVKLQ